jgi:hypothetical protein
MKIGDRMTGVDEIFRVAVEGQTRLFKYVEQVSTTLGRDRAWKVLEDIVLEKRMAWLDEKRVAPISTLNPVERAYHLFYHDYLGLKEGDVEVVERTPRRITMRWSNPCPTLEACKVLDIDTGFVCKRAYEGPTRAFVTRVHPDLRFPRNYDRIRPHSPFCEETIELA